MPGTVTVACKLPHGLVLQEQRMTKRTEPVMGGGYREFEQAERFGKKIMLAGSARPVNPEGEVEFAPMVGGYGLTPNVDKDFFERWLAQNAELDAVKNGFIFAAERDDTVKGRAREGKAGPCGLEPINPRNLPAEFQAVKPDERR
ncbi:hypothetical protein CIW48_27115 [Methylobacterium sp. P1-11]|uniref:hypothetical protein n=1 Tax=Methylobacterium sp. P1-11 TaxID=2024616 RepID=UPI0011EFC54F|nr:hypothetical protein [Methylobacterium sp. P1-11]KAA0117874.1 hypothetical protein CIW48_27115 [Methylobacterium sp. P1-11]